MATRRRRTPLRAVPAPDDDPIQSYESYDRGLELAMRQPPEFERCRATGRHAGEIIIHSAMEDGVWYEIEYQCTCGRVRKVLKSWRGYVIKQSARYPDGYVNKGQGMLDADARAALRSTYELKQIGAAKLPKPGAKKVKARKRRAS